MRTKEMMTRFPIGTVVTKRIGHRYVPDEIRAFTITGYGANGCLLAVANDTKRKCIVHTDDVEGEDHGH